MHIVYTAYVRVVPQKLQIHIYQGHQWTSSFHGLEAMRKQRVQVVSTKYEDMSVYFNLIIDSAHKPLKQSLIYSLAEPIECKLTLSVEE